MEPFKVSTPELSMPKGGGAIKGLGDAFSPAAFSGTGSYSIPIPLTESRALTPALALSYNSAGGNSPFGLGFSMELPGIRLATNKRMPHYEGKDTYTFAEAGPLVLQQGSTRQDTMDGQSYTVSFWLPRVEGAYTLIEQWCSNSTGIAFWKIRSKDNVCTFYGRNDTSRIANPDNPLQIFEWLPDGAFDALGNKTEYHYKSENDENVPASLSEVNRSFRANRYLSKLRYGNYIDTAGTEQFAFELILNYGEYDLQDPANAWKPQQAWACRPDPFSMYNSGFEVRTYRLCKDIMLFHCFPDQLGNDPCLVQSLALEYGYQQQYNPVQVTGMSQLARVTLTGYRKTDNGDFLQRQMPATDLSYSAFLPPLTPEFRQLSVENHAALGYLNDTALQQVDLYGDGLPGLFYNSKDVVLYMQPEGEGRYAAPEACTTFPLNKDFSTAAVHFADLDGNGRLELVVEGNGYYGSRDEGGWDNFRSFAASPVLTGPMLEAADLDADGKADLLLASEEDLLVYFSEGTAGYKPGQRIPNEYGFPLKKENYTQELVTFGNLFGDGLSHRIKITNGSVECWPCLGYGRFGKKVSLDYAPHFGDQFDSRRLFLADVDGSGTADLVYVYADRVMVFINQNGNSFSDPISLVLPAQYSDNDRISFSDILGNGTTCLVFTKMSPEPVHYYYSFVGEALLPDGRKQQTMKPYLLNSIDNNIGSRTEIQYCSSTKFALEDKLAGRPWATRLRFPVQVVAQKTVTDRISGTRFVNRFKYHDGYFDPVEREFRGFGYVESWDAESYEDFKQDPADTDFPVERINAELYMPPVYTRSWFHTGAYMASPFISRQYSSEYFHGDTKAYDFPDSIFEQDIYNDTDTLRQAYAALKGQSLRKEVYADDKGPLSANPYTVEESNCEVVLLQARADNRYAVFRVDQRESISYNYERNPDDPRVQQTFVLATDPLCGQATRTCTVFLPRRTLAGITTYPEQQLPVCTAATNDYISVIDQPAYRWVGVGYQAQAFELSRVDLSGKQYISFDAIRTQVTAALQSVIPYGTAFSGAAVQARQFSWSRTWFWNEAQTDRLPLGQVSSRALGYNTATAVLTPVLISAAFGSLLSDAIIADEGGYVFDVTTGYWWNQGLVQHYFLPAQPECFFMARATEHSFVAPASPLFHKTSLEYDQPYYLKPVLSRSYLSATVFNTQSFVVDYQSLQYRQTTDINGNIGQVLFDPLKRVIVTTLYGREKGITTGGMLLYDWKGQPAEYVPRLLNPSGGPITFSDVLANNEYYLQGAMSYFFYDLMAGAKDQPISAVSLLRDQYYHLDGSTSPFSCQSLIEFSDGLGHSIEKKKKTVPGLAIVRDGQGQLLRDAAHKARKELSTERWVVSGRTVYNNKDKTCQEYMPYFSNTPYYEQQQDIADEHLPPPAIVHYDPLGRSIRVDTPKGFFSKVVFNAWEEQHYDEDDTVIESPFYKANYPDKLSPAELDAIDKAKKFADTPLIKTVGNSGSVFLETLTFPDAKLLTTHTETDIEGRTICSIDPRLYAANKKEDTDYYNFRYQYAMGAEKPLYTDSADAGIQRSLNNIYGNACRSWNALEDCEQISYDQLQRRTALKVQHNKATALVEQLFYGEDQPDTGYNLRGQVIRQNDTSGVVLNSSYSLQKQLLQTSRQMTQEYKTMPSWDLPVLLEPEIYATEYDYNALEQLISESTPDGSVTTNTYSLAGQLYSISVSYNGAPAVGLISSIDYDAQQQRTRVVYANGIVTDYSYEDTTMRLSRLYSHRPGTTGAMLQDISYTYDPVGNLTQMKDDSFKSVFSNNQKVDAIAGYTYDAIYRLILANGRQHPGINANTYKNNIADNSFKQSIFSQLPDVNDQDKLENYSESYTYDDSDNLVLKKHTAVSASYSVDTAVADNCNRLKDMTYDAAGNQQALRINNSVPLAYDCFNNLVSATTIERPEQPDDSDYYQYNSSRKRTRKVTEKMVNGGASIELSEKIYIGNCEFKRNKTSTTGGTTTVTLERNTLRVMDGSNCLVISHYWVQDKLQREVDAAGTRSERFQMGNNLGSVSMEMDRAAQLISYEEYFPYGGTAIIAGTSQQEVAQKDYRYSGKECDDTTGLYYYGDRYYISWLGRWTAADPGGATDGLNLYTFVRNNPMKFVDHNGNISLLAAKVGINVASLFMVIAGPIWGGVSGAMAASSAVQNPVGKVFAGIGGAIGGAIVGTVLGAVTSALTIPRWFVQAGVDIYRWATTNNAGTHPAILYNESQRTPVLGIHMETGRIGAESMAEHLRIPRNLWDRHIRPFNARDLTSITPPVGGPVASRFNGRLVMVGHGNEFGSLETVGHPRDLSTRETEVGGGIVSQLGADRGHLSWRAVTDVDMCICFGDAFADDMRPDIARRGAAPDIAIRASTVSVTPIGNLHNMGVIRDASNPFKEFLHWATFGLYAPGKISSAPPPDPLTRNSRAVNNTVWATHRT